MFTFKWDHVTEFWLMEYRQKLYSSLQTQPRNISFVFHDLTSLVSLSIILVNYYLAHHFLLAFKYTYSVFMILNFLVYTLNLGDLV